MRITAALPFLLFLAACVETDAVRCADGTLCRFGSVCASVTGANGDQLPLCVKPDQLCTTNGAYCDDQHTQRCYDGVCLAAGCGNGLMDPEEVCDDGNTAPGDQCSADCLSKEVCRDGHLDLVTGESCDDGNAIGHDGCSGLCVAETPHWVDLRETIGELYAASLVYDAARDVVVLYGGYEQQGNGDLSNTVWEWDHRRWKRAPAPISPPGRYYGWLAYDAGRRRTIAYGGLGPAGEVWEWDGAQWTVIDPPAAPDLGYAGALVYDATHHRTVLAGPNGSATWDGRVWTPLGASPVVGQATLGYDPVRGVVVLLDGNFSGQQPRVYELAGTTWVEHTPASQPADLTASYETARFVWDGPAHQLVFASAGASGWYAWTGTAWVLVPNSVPPWNGDNEAEVVGTTYGFVAFVKGKTYTKNSGGTWQLETPAEPTPRGSAAAAVDPVGRTLFVAGGADLVDASAETWKWDGAWTRLPDLPARRTNASAAYDTARDQLVLFGGFDYASSVADTLVFGQILPWKPIAAGPQPAPRMDAAMTYDAARKEVVLFGGTDQSSSGANTTYADTWVFDGAHWQQRATGAGAVTPGKRAGAGFVFDPIRKRAILFGGYDGTNNGPLTDTWEWDGAAWTEVQTADRPPGRYRVPLAWDPPLERALLVSGDPAFNDVWAYDGPRDGHPASWTRIAIDTQLPGRAGMNLVPSPFGDGVIAFGGGNGAGPRPQLALLRWDGGASETCTSDADDADGDGLSGCADPDCWATCTPEVPPGVPTPPSPRTDLRCGDGLCDGRRETCTTCPSDCNCITICGDFVCSAGETAATCPGDCTP